ncbi:MAG: hypothetical protein WA830_01915 [Candidatus Sulfotelmatobacter sp.]
MKYATRMLVLALTMLPVLATAQLGSSQKIVVQVPFEFVVGSKVVPSGEWIIQPASVAPDSLMIRNNGAAVGMFSAASLLDAKEIAGNYALVFHKYGNSYFLSGVKIKGTRTGYRIPQSKAEAEMRARNLTATEETVLASLK